MRSSASLIIIVLTTSLVAAEASRETVESAGWLLQKATLAQRDGRHNLLLRALRQLRDPKLEPFFAGLVEHEQPTMKYHALLGLAEMSSQRKLDLALFGEIKDVE